MTTPLFDVPEWAENQTEPRLTVNEAIRYLEVIASRTVIAVEEETPPGSPAAGDAYILGEAPTGAWVGHPYELAFYLGTVWAFIDVPLNYVVYDGNGDAYQKQGGSPSPWVQVATGLSPVTAFPDLNDVPASYAGAARNGVRVNSAATGLEFYAPGGGAGIRYTVDTGSTADSDPGSGLLKFNNATQASATQIYVDNEAAGALDLTTLLASLPQDGYLTLVDAFEPGIWAIFRITAITAASGYYKLTVVYQASSDEFSDEAVVLVSFDAAGTATPTDASDVTYGASGGGWGSPTPETVEEALDILRAQVDAYDPRGRHAIYIAAGSITPSASGGCASLATIASAANQPDIQTLNFDATTQEYAQFSIRMPKSWDEGTITFAPVWSHPSTTTNFGVVWDLQAVAVSNDDAIAVAFGTAQTSTDTGGTTNDIYVGPESSAITVAGTPAAEDVVFFRLSRVTGNGSDTLAVDARLHGVTVYLNTNAATDA